MPQPCGRRVMRRRWGVRSNCFRRSETCAIFTGKNACATGKGSLFTSQAGMPVLPEAGMAVPRYFTGRNACATALLEDEAQAAAQGARLLDKLDPLGAI